MSSNLTDWGYDEDRMDLIGQNGNDGAAYEPEIQATGPEYTGGSVSYYRVTVEFPTSADIQPYTAECNDIIEALGMNYAEGNAFKALWRRCAARTLGLAKAGYRDGVYDAEKAVFFTERVLIQEQHACSKIL